ncbi:hypothetical protein L2E82_32898 [Cichorium intybus]|uniref:Uncharacterized protein n=1 Tax=Cichorium intybus TaxID=13427 RepID=A0ACB9BHQ2_CICIN|nr:hypothetical protein L2E82_32898 [Cichorium intybus]
MSFFRRSPSPVRFIPDHLLLRFDLIPEISFSGSTPSPVLLRVSLFVSPPIEAVDTVRSVSRFWMKCANTKRWKNFFNLKQTITHKDIDFVNIFHIYNHQYAPLQHQSDMLVNLSSLSTLWQIHNHDDIRCLDSIHTREDRWLLVYQRMQHGGEI